MHELDGHVRGVGRIGAPPECIDAAARAQAFGNRARRARDIFGVRIEEVLRDRRAAANRRRNSNREFGRRCTLAFSICEGADRRPACRSLWCRRNR